MNKIIALIATLAVVLAGLVVAPAAYAGDGRVRTAVKSCDTFIAGYAVRATFYDPARYHGKGMFRVKQHVKFGGAFPYNGKYESDAGPYKLKNTKQGLNWDFNTNVGARHNWKSAYYDAWWAEAVFKLQKKKGPVWRTKESVKTKLWATEFKEMGGGCFSPGFG